MHNLNTIIVDFVAKGQSPDQWKMVLVEEGPWVGPIEPFLQKLQNRLYGVVDAVLDGQLAEKFPESKGKSVVIQVDAYNLPRFEVDAFFCRFSKGVLSIPEYRSALKGNPFVKNITFHLKIESIH